MRIRPYKNGPSQPYNSIFDTASKIQLTVRTHFQAKSGPGVAVASRYFIATNTGFPHSYEEQREQMIPTGSLCSAAPGFSTVTLTAFSEKASEISGLEVSETDVPPTKGDSLPMPVEFPSEWL